MGLKQDIVIVNEFTIKGKTGKGSRGSSPGRFLERYVGRDGASDKLTPLKYDDLSSYVETYMARESAINRLGKTFEHDRVEKYSNVGFTNYDVNLSQRKFKKASKAIQKYYEQGKTVMKTVISFSHEYLVRKGIVDPTLTNDKKYCYHDNYDQLKLRLGIMNGLKRMGRSYDDLFAVGVIQVDTKQLHCHLVMVDRGKGRLSKDGTQVGKINSKKKGFLRSGIDRSLDGMAHYTSFLKSNTQAKENLRTYIRRHTYNKLEDRGTIQFLLAMLPQDKTLWRYGTNRKDMKQANFFMEQFVEKLYEKKDSGYSAVKSHLDHYIEDRSEKEGLSPKKKNILKERVYNKLMEESVNSVYASLKTVLSRDRTVMTPMLHAMTEPLENLVSQDDDLSKFTYRFRSYSKRMKDARNRQQIAERFVAHYEKSPTSKDSLPLYKFFKFEERYYEGVHSKYQHFLNFYPSKKYYEEELNAYLEYKDKVDRYELMLNDKNVNRFSEASAEAYCKATYNHHGGRYLKNMRGVNELRFQKMNETLGEKEKVLNEKLNTFGLSYNKVNDRVEKNLHDFEDVKWLDLHKLGFDFIDGFEVSEKNKRKYIEMVGKRVALYNDALRYLIDTNQKDTLSIMPSEDINMSALFAKKLSSNNDINTVLPPTSKRKRDKTVSLDYEVNLMAQSDLEDTMTDYVDDSIYDLNRSL